MATIANQNGRNMVQYILLPVNIHFHWNRFIFEFLTMFKMFILAAILNILKTKSTTWVMIYFCVKFQKDPLFGVNLKFLCLGYHGNILHFDFFNPSKAATHYGGYSCKASLSLMKGIPFFFNLSFFVSMTIAKKFVQPIPIFLAYLVPLDMDVVPIKFRQFLFGE